MLQLFIAAIFFSGVICQPGVNRTCTERVSCFDCSLAIYDGFQCGWCYAGRGNTGCVPGTANGPLNAAVRSLFVYQYFLTYLRIVT